MAIDALGPMPDRHHHTVRTEHGIGIEMRFDLLVGIARNLATQGVASPVIEEKDRPASVVVCLTTKVEQTLNDDGRNAALLQPGLSVVCDPIFLRYPVNRC